MPPIITAAQASLHCPPCCVLPSNHWLACPTTSGLCLVAVSFSLCSLLRAHCIKALPFAAFPLAIAICPWLSKHRCFWILRCGLYCVYMQRVSSSVAHDLFFQLAFLGLIFLLVLSRLHRSRGLLPLWHRLSQFPPKCTEAARPSTLPHVQGQQNLEPTAPQALVMPGQLTPLCLFILCMITLACKHI